MGFFGGLLAGAGSTIMNGLIGGLSGGTSSLVGGLFNRIGEKKRMKRAIKMQTDAQKELNEQAAQLNYEYGEKAAKNAYARQLEMYNRSYQDQSYSAMRKQMEDAGLSVGLMYGGSGSGGGEGATTGAPQGATGGAQAGQAIQASEILALQLQNKKLAAETNLLNAQALKAQKEAEKAGEDAETIDKIRDVYIKNIKEEAYQKWMQNWDTYMLRMSGDWSPEQTESFNDSWQDDEIKDFWYSFNARSPWYRNNIVEVTKKLAEKHNAEKSADMMESIEKLNNEKAVTIWGELIIAAYNAESQRIEALAKELSTYWETGEYTNWKTWAALGIKVVEEALGVKPKKSTTTTIGPKGTTFSTTKTK